MDVFRKLGQKLRAEGNVSLVTIPNVPIISTGIEYPLSTGPATFTEDDLRDAVRAAEEDPHIRSPRIKVAYGTPHEEAIAEPAFGTVTNLRLGDNDQTIYGDITGIPSWLAGVLPVAYPSRSIEANRNCETVGGKKYRLVIDCVALLGVHLPGVTSLSDLPLYYGSAAPDGLELIESPIQASGVAAAVGIEDIRRNYYDSLDTDQSWWWIRAMELEDTGGYLVVDDDQGELYKVEFAVSGEEVSFEDPRQVKIVYQDVPKEQMAASVVQGMADIHPEMTVYASRADSRPATATKEGGVDLDSKALAKKLGLPEDATEEQINAKLDERLESGDGDGDGDGDGEQEQPVVAPDAADPAHPEGDTPNPAPGTGPGTGNPAGPPVDDEGFVRLDKETYDQIAASGQKAAAYVAGQEKAERESIVSAAVKAGKIAPASRDNWLRMLENDPDQGKKLLTASAEDGGLAANAIPVEMRGNGGGSESEQEVEGLPEDWFGGAVAASKKRAETQRKVTFAREA